MNYGGDAADQIVRYSLDGVDHGLRLSGTLAKHLAVFVAAVLKDQKKTRGRTRMVRMLKENKPLKFLLCRLTACVNSAVRAGSEGCSM